MLREKDRELGGRCRRLGETAVNALGWLADNEKLVGARRSSLERTFKKHAVEARKLARAAERPMSVAVFGASQAGKSFLIGSLITPPSRPVKVIFGEGEDAERLDFLDEVNPQGGKETTGLVTRFSITPMTDLPKGFPVVLRLLSEVDIVKILANTFVYDLSAQGDTKELTGEYIRTVMEELASGASDKDRGDLVIEDIFELREYVEKNLPRHPLRGQLAESYWASAERYLARLDPQARAKAFSLLWGELPEFTNAYLTLKDALDKLGRPEYAFAPLEAVRDRASGVLHVDTLLGLDLQGADGLDATQVEALKATTLMSQTGQTVNLPKPVVTALTAELRVTLDEAPWDFFTHTDLLDFPGARSREDSTPARLLRDPEQPTARAYCFLRGKVAVLFDKYAEDLDLNSMLLCVGPENPEVKKLPELVENWIAGTHGARAEDRTNKRTALFFCLTKCDTLFDLSAGQEGAERVLTNRLDNNISNFPGWTTDWQPGKAFSNCYLIRNPKGKKREDLFLYESGSAAADEVPPESALREDKAEWLGGYFKTFEQHALVVKHISQGTEKWDAMLALNDGGISFLAENLAPVCDPDLKYDQIAPRGDDLARQMLSELMNFHESGDLERRVAERLEKITDVIHTLANVPDSIGRFIHELQLDEAFVGARFIDQARRQHFKATENGGGGAKRGSNIKLKLKIPGLSQKDEAPPQAASQAASFGEEIVEKWIDNLERKALNEELSRAYGLSPEQFAVVINELAVAARRYDLIKEIEEYVAEIYAYRERPDEVVHRVSMGVSLFINDLVNYLGSDQPDDEGEDSEADQTNGETLLFQRDDIPGVGEPPRLAADLDELMEWRGAYISDWLGAIYQLTRKNASWGQGGLVDIEQNQRLGDIIGRIES